MYYFKICKSDVLYILELGLNIKDLLLKLFNCSASKDYSYRLIICLPCLLFNNVVELIDACCPSWTTYHRISYGRLLSVPRKLRALCHTSIVCICIRQVMVKVKRHLLIIVYHLDASAASATCNRVLTQLLINLLLNVLQAL